MKCPKISIITICYNCEKEIEDTILSVINQGYENKEYIIIDGESKDNTMSIVGKYGDKINIVVSEPDKGRSDAFNKGVMKATGDYIVMINAGDLLVENALKNFADTYQDGYDVIKGNTIRWNPKSGFKSIEIPVCRYPAIPFNFYVGHQATYISKAAYRRYGGYDVGLKIAMDFELMLRFTRLGAKFHAIDEILAVFRMGGISQTSSKRRIDEMKYAMLKNGRNKLHVSIFTFYVRCRTIIRKFIDQISPDLKSWIVTKRICNR